MGQKIQRYRNASLTEERDHVKYLRSSVELLKDHTLKGKSPEPFSKA